MAYLGIEGQDFVVCRECGHQAPKLYRHLEKHGLDTKTYKERHGNAPLRCDVVVLRQTTTRTARLLEVPKTWVDTKDVPCSTCGKPHAVSKHMGNRHDLRCPECKGVEILQARDSEWANHVEGQDYVRCVECDFLADSLTSHVYNSHPGYRERHPEAPIVAMGSAGRDKTALRGRELSDETKIKMSANAGRWNAGLTKETDSRIAEASEKLIGRTVWNVGLTKETDPRIAEAAEKLKRYVGESRAWIGGEPAANFTPEDFEPYLDEFGLVDRREAEAGLGASWRTIFKYMEILGLATSDRYVKQRAVRATIRLERDLLLQFALGNGKVSIGAAMAGLRHNFPVISRECKRHNLETFHRRIRQTLCLDAVSKALGGVDFVQEWEEIKFTNVKTGRRFRFDGYFQSIGLIVEFHGHQHWQFPNAFMLDESSRPSWEEMQWRDAEKQRLVEATPGMCYLAVREDEPFTDPLYLTERLVELGLLEPKSSIC